MKSYVKFLSRNKLYIEALGLSVALAFVILSFLRYCRVSCGNEWRRSSMLQNSGQPDLGHGRGVLSFHPGNRGWTRFREYYAPQGRNDK